MTDKPINLADYRKDKIVVSLNPRVDECLEDLRWVINKYYDLNPVIVVGMFSSFTGRLVGMADPKLETDLLAKTLLTVQIFAEKEAQKNEI